MTSCVIQGNLDMFNLLIKKKIRHRQQRYKLLALEYKRWNILELLPGRWNEDITNQVYDAAVDHDALETIVKIAAKTGRKPSFNLFEKVALKGNPERTKVLLVKEALHCAECVSNRCVGQIRSRLKLMDLLLEAGLDLFNEYTLLRAIDFHDRDVMEHIVKTKVLSLTKEFPDKVIGAWKYNGKLCIEMLEFVKKLGEFQWNSALKTALNKRVDPEIVEWLLTHVLRKNLREAAEIARETLSPAGYSNFVQMCMKLNPQL